MKITKKHKFLAVCIAALTFFQAVVLSSCGKKDNYTEIQFFALDTIISLKTSDGKGDLDAAEKRIADLESLFSKTIIGSDTYLANTDIDILVDVSEDFSTVCKKAIEISRATNGAFDITVGTLKELWESKAANGKEPTEKEIENALTYVGTDKILITEERLEKAYKLTHIDLGGIGKGYAAEKAVKVLKESGAESGILSLGGNIAVFGQKSDGSDYKIALKNPSKPDSSLGNILLDEGYISVSGGYERSITIGETEYCHIIDPRNGYPVANGVLSVAVISPDGTLADALSTALFVMGHDEAVEFYKNSDYEFEFIMVTNDDVIASAGLNGRFDAARGVNVNYIEY